MIHKRKQARSHVLQTLFYTETKEKMSIDDIIQAYRYIVEEIDTKGASDDEYAQSLLHGIYAKKDTLKEIITKSIKDTLFEDIAVIDRCILYIGIYELLFGKEFDVPEKVAINEAIELAKNFSSDGSAKFINGVMGFIYKEMGEPGKDILSEKKNTKEVAGALVYTKDNRGDIWYGFILDPFNRWTLPKGVLKDKEKPKNGAMRVVKEELGVEGVLEEEIEKNSYIGNHPVEGKVYKTVTYFLVYVEGKPELFVPNKESVLDAKWFPVYELQSLRLYPDIRKIITPIVEEKQVVRNI